MIFLDFSVVDGGKSTTNGGSMTTQALLLSGVAVDTQGNIYVSEINYNRVMKISADGMITTIAGGASACIVVTRNYICIVILILFN